ncbi:MAG: sulfite reductase subunit alpha [Verrucomicrobiales bacterium]|nr:sulfite reductase subunit alpha [Verrucomicrobiales bacterium]
MPIEPSNPPLVPYIPSTAPFSVEQRAWLNGYLAGLFSNAHVAEPVEQKKKLSLVVLFGSQTGSAEKLAKRIGADSSKMGFAPKVLEMNAFGSLDWAVEERIILVTSTWGEGDPPDNATAFWAHLNSPDAPRLDKVHFAVLALGDKNYSDFCGAGKKFDTRFEVLGGKRLIPRVDCDTDYEKPALEFISNLWNPLAATSHQGGIISASTSTEPAALEPEGYSKQKPFPARLLVNRKLNREGSGKDTRHFEISLEGSGLTYAAGDALGIYASNCPTLVAHVLEALGFDGEEGVKNPTGMEVSLRSALLSSFQLGNPSMEFVAEVQKRSEDADLKSLLDPANKEKLDKFVYGKDILDFLKSYPGVRFTPSELVTFLRKLQPRLYSISSSPKAHPGQVHITVAVVRYEAHGRERKGVCSTFLAERADGATATIPVFIQPSHGFRLPSDGNIPVIMVGPGTGIAPFRAFLEERRETGAKGKNWLFFGDQKRSHDFLYQEELETMMKNSHLHRLDTAFSRDQAEKIYVQDRMLKQGDALWKWLEEGAHVYVCGDAKRMAKDVDLALHQVIQTAGGKSEEEARNYVAQLKKDKKYQRDVY